MFLQRRRAAGYQIRRSVGDQVNVRFLPSRAWYSYRHDSTPGISLEVVVRNQDGDRRNA